MDLAEKRRWNQQTTFPKKYETEIRKAFKTTLEKDKIYHDLGFAANKYKKNKSKKKKAVYKKRRRC